MSHLSPLMLMFRTHFSAASPLCAGGKLPSSFFISGFAFFPQAIQQASAKRVTDRLQTPRKSSSLLDELRREFDTPRGAKGHLNHQKPYEEAQDKENRENAAEEALGREETGDPGSDLDLEALTPYAAIPYSSYVSICIDMYRIDPPVGASRPRICVANLIHHNPPLIL